MSRISAWHADITTLDVDAIVNAANTSLLGGGGVDGAIHRKAGPELLAECRTLGGCRVGEAKLTRGYRLPARYVIHTVGPRYGMPYDAELLASCYRQSMAIARDSFVRVAFPAISTGVYGYPMLLASQIAVSTILSEPHDRPLPAEVIMCTFDDSATEIMREVLGELA